MRGHSAETEYVAVIISERVLTEIGFCGNSLGLIMGDIWWDGIEERGTWHETDGGYLWILVV